MKAFLPFPPFRSPHDSSACLFALELTVVANLQQSKRPPLTASLSDAVHTFLPRLNLRGFAEYAVDRNCRFISVLHARPAAQDEASAQLKL